MEDDKLDLLIIFFIGFLGLMIGTFFKSIVVLIATIVIVIYMILNKTRPKYPNEK